METPRHERVSLRPSERAEFLSLTRRFVTEPVTSSRRRSSGRSSRARIQFYGHLRLGALLLPIGLVVMFAAIATWWPLGVIGAAVVIIGQTATFELLRARRVRRRLRKTTTTTRSKPC